MNETPPVEPIRSTVAGGELMTIPASHYAELLECQRAVRNSGFQEARSRVHPALKALDPRKAIAALKSMKARDRHSTARNEGNRERTAR